MIRVRRDGVWFWAGRFGLLLRSHAAHPPLFSERHARSGCWSRRVGLLRLTLRWPVRETES